jgi:hypothetical protein
MRKCKKNIENKPSTIHINNERENAQKKTLMTKHIK